MDYNLLSGSPLFRGLDPVTIQPILTEAGARTRKYGEGTLIFSSGDQVNSFCIVTGGYVKGEMIDFTGRVIKIEDIKAPGAIAPAFMFGHRNRYPVNVIAMQNTSLVVIEKAGFLRMLKDNGIILINFLDMISNRSQFLSDKIRFLNFKTIKSKLAQYILELAGGNKTEIRLDRTQSDLADYFGVARPSVARALGELEELGIIETRGKNIRLLKRQGLSDLITE